MVEPAFLAVLAIGFVVALVIILRGGSVNSHSQNQVKEKKERGNKPVKEKKPKAPKRTALKKDERPDEIKEWSSVDSAAKDAQDVLEFLKGKDPVEIARQQAGSQTKQQQGNKKKGGNNTTGAKKAAQDEVVEPAVAEPIPEGFSVISTKKSKQSKQPKQDDKKNKPEGQDKNKTKAFFKDEAPPKDEERKGARRSKREKNQSSEEGGVPEEREKKRNERPPQSERDQRPPRQDNKERSPKEGREQGRPREKRENREGGVEGEERPRPKRQYPTSPPNVAYVEADLNDILNAITEDYNKPKPQHHRIHTSFSKIPRNIIISILAKLEANDLVALSEVNYYFSALARKESLWRDLLLKDFGLRDLGKYRGFRAAYRGEYKKKKQHKKKQEAAPQGEAKENGDEDHKAKGAKKEGKKKKDTEKLATEGTTEESESKEDKE